MAAFVPLLQSLCHGCLSADRVLSPIGEFKTIYKRMCTVQTEPSIKDTNLCWECTATLKRIQTFNKQVKEAQNKLRLFIRKKDNSLPKSLSKLNTYKTNHNFISITETEIEIKKEDDSDFSAAPNEEKELQDDPTFIVKLKDTEQCVTESEIKIKNEDHSDSSNAPNEEEEMKEDPTFIVDLKDLKEKPQNQRQRYYDRISTAEEMCVKEQARQSDLVHFWVQDGSVPQRSDASGTMCMKSEDYLKVDISTNENIGTYSSNNHNEHKPYICNLCHACYRTLEELSSHVTSHDVYRCLVCGHRSPSLEEAGRHVTQHREIVKCRLCEYCCRTCRQFREHYKIAHVEFLCDHCGKKFRSKRKLELHISVHHTDRGFQCHQCPRTFSLKRRLAYHIAYEHDVCETEETFCVECNVQFKNRRRFKTHLYNKHADQLGKPGRKERVKCLQPGCTKMYAQRAFMMYHYQYVHEGRSRYHCSICDKYFLSPSRYNDHRRYTHEGAQRKRDKICGVCGRGFSVNKTLKHHMRTHTGERPHACAVCDARFAQKGARDLHQKKHYKQTNTN